MKTHSLHCRKRWRPVLVSVGILFGAACARNEPTPEKAPLSENFRTSPKAMVALSAIGDSERGTKLTGIDLDESFWRTITEDNSNTPVPIADGSERNFAYAGLMHIVASHCAGSREASMEHMIATFHAVLNWGLVSDYLAVSGGLKRIEAKFGDNYFLKPGWESLFARLSNVVPFIENDLNQIEAPSEAKRVLGDIYSRLFTKNSSLKEFKESVVNSDKAMREPSGSISSEVAALYFHGPALATFAVPVYRNRAILLKIHQNVTSEPARQP